MRLTRTGLKIIMEINNDANTANCKFSFIFFNNWVEDPPNTYPQIKKNNPAMKSKYTILLFFINGFVLLR